MELDRQLMDEIAGLFKNVQYGKITFHLSPEKKTLDYSIETTGKIPIARQFSSRDLRLTKSGASA